jgi:hypothetical protein
MNMPGFTAEASLYQAGEHYHAAIEGTHASGSVYPAQQLLGGIFSLPRTTLELENCSSCIRPGNSATCDVIRVNLLSATPRSFLGRVNLPQSLSSCLPPCIA